ncbi:MAG: aminoglycoside phosphotransferase family protein [Micrococcales bacterium]|nr:aminoglycoside phosphotransferase family protein [Micrococcales bacterium]MCL2669013.1 aminoglycoside phosphotransferase family protein [Micrococcales bacterium]
MAAPELDGDPDPLHDDVPGPVVDIGTFATLYALDDTRVLRRYRSGRDAGGEARLLTHLHSCGVPVPRTTHLGGPDLEVERLHGPTLLQGLVSGEVGIRQGVNMLADLHTQLHAAPVPPDLPGTPGARIVHLDLHPGTVVLSEEHGPVVVAWGSATLDDPAIDHACTALIIGEVAADGGEEYAPAARAFLAAFLHACPRFAPTNLAAAADHRLGDPSLSPAERDLVPASQNLVTRLLEITGHP